MTKKNNQLLMLLSAVGLMAFTACTNDKYDLGDIDMTIGVGSDDGLTLPTSSTKEILLDDLLELSSNESVVFDADSNYVFLQEGSDVAPAHPVIDEITITEKTSSRNPLEIDIDLPTDLPSYEGEIPNTANSIEAVVYTFDYEGAQPEAVETLESADIKGNIEVNIEFTEDLNGFIPEFKTFYVEFPEYMEIAVPAGYASQCHVLETKPYILVVDNKSTKEKLQLIVELKKLNFNVTDEDANNTLTFNGSTVIMNGEIKLNVAWDNIRMGSGDISNLKVNNEMKIDEFTIVGATGRFNPTIDIQNLGDATIGELPDFLTDEDVKLDLYNPTITINLESDMTVPGFLSGTLTAKDANGNIAKDKETGEDIAPIVIEDVEIKANADSKIVISRRDPGEVDYIPVVRDEELAGIIKNLSNISTLSFTASARANDKETGYIELGVPYTIAPSYSIEAPIAFGKDARIVYNDTWDGWNDDIQDYEFAAGAYVNLTADIENCIPAYLTMSATAIDVNGNDLSDRIMAEVDKTIAPSKDGQTPETTSISVTIKEEIPGALQSVDGLTFTIEAAAADENGNNPIEGITLNAKKHHLTAKNIKVTVKGKVIIKTDD